MDSIERQAAIEAFMTATSDGDKFDWCKWVLKQVPSAQPKKGKWIYDYDKDEAPFFMQGWKCSACGKRQTYGEAPFCMYCGAEMEHSDGYEERQRKLRELIERDET